MWWNDNRCTSRLGQANRYAQALTKFHGQSKQQSPAQPAKSSRGPEKLASFRQLHLTDEQRAANLELCQHGESPDDEICRLESQIEQLQADIESLETIIREGAREQKSQPAETARLKSECERWLAETESLLGLLTAANNDRLEIARQFEIARAELQELRYLHRPTIRLSEVDPFQFPAAKETPATPAKRAA